ncbi:hypothetical protein BS78_09G017000 [Paspalum vaginatum]|nr:hypothetical protein BS78_09G017000 [Paspalum vaginatum]
MDRPKTKRSAAASAFPSLPDDGTVEILSRVPAKSLCRFKCVSKGWRDLISERLRCKKLPQTLEGFFYADDKVHGGNGDGHGKEEVCVDIQWRFINTLGRPVPLVDSSFSFLLAQLPWTESIGLLQSCNGLLLVGHKWGSDMYDSLGYIVCNPTTEQWMSVPSSGWTPFLDESEDEDEDSEPAGFAVTNLIFDPAVSSHFHLVQFGMDCDWDFDSCYTYSSETGVWCTGASEWSDDDSSMISVVGSAFVCGMLHLSITKLPEPLHSGLGTHQELIVAVDAEGRKHRTLSWPKNRGDAVFLGQSQGCLHYITEHTEKGREITELCI